MRLSLILISAGSVMVTLAVCIVFFTYLPVIRNESSFALNEAKRALSGGAAPAALVPVDDQFGIVIPRLGANARVIANVDPYNSTEYQKALSLGVAHAKGTVFPGQVGNVFLFSHSSVDFYVALQYNSVFYLISKLEKGDAIDLYYKGEAYRYTVTKKATVAPSDTSFLTAQTSNKQVTLMTCWPPGTTINRLIVTGELVAR